MKEYTKKTISIYDKLGNKYLSDIDKATPDEIRIFIDKLPSKASVLDVGCAGGRDSKIFADHGFNVTGIDLCEPFLQEAKRRVTAGIFLKKDILELDFEEACFDGIWACAVLLHLEKRDLPKVLCDFYHLLKPHGCLFIGVKQGEGERSVVDRLSDGNSRFFSFYQQDEIEIIVRAAGFTITYSEIKDDDTGRGEVKWIRMIAKKAYRSVLANPLSPSTSLLIEKYQQAQAFYEEALKTFRKTDQYDHFHLINELPPLYELIETLRSTLNDWLREYEADDHDKYSLESYKKRYEHHVLVLGLEFSYLCKGILSYNFSEKAAKNVKRLEHLNDKAMGRI